MSVDVGRHSELASSVLPAPHLVIGGERRTSSSAGSVAHVNPATGQPQADVLLAGASEIDDAVGAARAAFALS